MMPFYWVGGSDLRTSCLERPEGDLRHSGNKAWNPNVLRSSPPLLPPANAVCGIYEAQPWNEFWDEELENRIELIFVGRSTG